MSRIKIEPKSATTEQVAAQLLTILRENSGKRPSAGYYSGCLESILQFEFAANSKKFESHGGGTHITYHGSEGPAWLRKKYFEAVNWLRQRGYIVRDHTQNSDQFAEVTADGLAVEIETASMSFIIPRNWTHWRTEYQNGVVHLGIRKDEDEFSGSAFQIRPNLYATCEHNFDGDVFAYIDGVAIPTINEKKHPTADVAIFSLTQPRGGVQSLRLRNGNAQPGEEVAALGFPSVPRRQPTLNISVGAIESLPTNYQGDSQFIQMNIQISGGYSGGPLIDTSGRVVGIVSERTFEAVADSTIPSRAFSQVVPVHYLVELF